MYQKLRRFQAERFSGGTSTSFWERFKFLKKEKDRDACLANLRTWNTRIGIVIEHAHRKYVSRKAVSMEHKGPSSQLRTLSQRLFTALSKCWACDCTSRHEARFCLASCNNLKRDPTEYGISFDFLVSHTSCHTTQKWREGTVTIRNPR